MKPHRLQRIQELLRTEIMNLILHEIKDPRIGFITITEVDVSKDLHYAKVYFSTLGGKSQREKTLQGLQSAAAFLRTQLAHNLTLKFTPELHFFFDDSFERAEHITKLLSNIHHEDDNDNSSA